MTILCLKILFSIAQLIRRSKTPNMQLKFSVAHLAQIDVNIQMTLSMTQPISMGPITQQILLANHSATRIIIILRTTDTMLLSGVLKRVNLTCNEENILFNSKNNEHRVPIQPQFETYFLYRAIMHNTSSQNSMQHMMRSLCTLQFKMIQYFIDTNSKPG